jgi:hypothetical protein
LEQLMKKVSSLCGERNGWQGGPQPPLPDKRRGVCALLGWCYSLHWSFLLLSENKKAPESDLRG